MIAEEVAAKFGTPVYVYDLQAVRDAHADLRSALPAQAGLYYSLKANPHPEVAAELARLGCRAEVSSQGEIDTAIGAGFQAARMLLTGPGKTADTIAHAMRSGVRAFSVESPADLARIGSLAAAHGTAARCLLRVNADQPVPGLGLAMTGTASQFGADASWVSRQPELFRQAGAARVTGLHLYMGTNIEDEATLLAQFRVAVGIAASLAGPFGGFAEVDLGGGFGTPYARRGGRPLFGGLARQLTELLDGHLPGWRQRRPLITFESGRYLVGSAGSLICRVVDTKVSKGVRFAVLDAGVNHLGGMMGLRRIPPIVPDLLTLPGDGNGARVPTTVTGPLCTPLDTLARDAQLPPLAAGQLVAIPNVGAYGLTASLMAFLGHPAPAEVVVNGDKVASASQIQLTRTHLLAREPARSRA